MTLVRKPHQPLQTLTINESMMKRWPMALLTIVVVRRSFVGLLLGTLLINLSQRTAPSVWYPSSHNDVLSTMSNNTGSIPSSGSGSIPEQNQQLPSVLEQMFSSDNKESEREIILVNATLREYAGSVPWMERHHFLPAVGDVSDEHRICFVHVGKTAGSTMACYLGFQYPVCKNRMYKLPGRLPQWTTNLMHTHYDNCQYEHINLFLFTLRDPVARMQSWFRYEYPKEDDSSASKGVLFVDCGFRSLEELAGPRGLGAMGRTLCSRRAWWAIRGTVGFKVSDCCDASFLSYVAGRLLFRVSSYKLAPSPNCRSTTCTTLDITIIAPTFKIRTPALPPFGLSTCNRIGLAWKNAFLAHRPVARLPAVRHLHITMDLDRKTNPRPGRPIVPM